MTIQLSKAQIEALKVELAKYGLNVSVARHSTSTDKVQLIKAWHPQTPAGNKCKSRMLMFAKMPPIEGVKNYQVKGNDGKWYSEGDDGFPEAKQYQAWYAAQPESRRDML